MEVHGVKLLKYLPDNKQGDPDPRYFGEITGLMNVSACVAVGPDGDPSDGVGPDILLSFPHFCYVDPSVAEQVKWILTMYWKSNRIFSGWCDLINALCVKTLPGQVFGFVCFLVNVLAKMYVLVVFAAPPLFPALDMWPLRFGKQAKNGSALSSAMQVIYVILQDVHSSFWRLFEMKYIAWSASAEVRLHCMGVVHLGAKTFSLFNISSFKHSSSLLHETWKSDTILVHKPRKSNTNLIHSPH